MQPWAFLDLLDHLTCWAGHCSWYPSNDSMMWFLNSTFPTSREPDRDARKLVTCPCCSNKLLTNWNGFRKNLFLPFALFSCFARRALCLSFCRINYRQSFSLLSVAFDLFQVVFFHALRTLILAEDLRPLCHERSPRSVQARVFNFTPDKWKSRLYRGLMATHILYEPDILTTWPPALQAKMVASWK